MNNNLPPYINYPGNMIIHPPCNMDNADMYGFFVKGELEALQASVDQCLNTPANGKMQFKVLSPYIMLTFTQVGKVAPVNPPGKDYGWFPEGDVIPWIMVGSMVEHKGKQKLDHIFWYPRFTWVDDGMAMITGREVLGYPKYLGDITMPKKSGDPATNFSCSVKAFQPFNVATEMAIHPLIEVNQTKDGPVKKIKTIFDLIELASKTEDLLDFDLAGIEQILDIFKKPGVDQLFLKQFPNCRGDKAIYQAIIHAPAAIKKIHSVELLGGQYKLTVQQVDSFPLVETLGLKLGDQQTLLPFHVNFDFVIENGTELVNNSDMTS